MAKFNSDRITKSMQTSTCQNCVCDQNDQKLYHSTLDSPTITTHITEMSLMARYNTLTADKTFKI